MIEDEEREMAMSRAQRMVIDVLSTVLAVPVMLVGLPIVWLARLITGRR